MWEQGPGRGTGEWGPGIQGEEAWAWQPAGWELPPLGLRPPHTFPESEEETCWCQWQAHGAMTVTSTSSVQTLELGSSQS